MRPKAFGFARRRGWSLTRIVAAALVAGFASFGLAGEARALVPSTTNVSSSPNPSNIGQLVTITVTVTGAGATPTGSVLIDDYGDGAGGDTAGLVAGVATFTHTYTTAGSGGLRATYLGDGTYSSSVQQVIHSVNQNPTTTTLSGSPSPSTVGQPVTFTATVSG